MPKKEEDYLEYVKQLNESPVFNSIAKKLDYNKIGLQILRNEEVLREFTSHNENGKITKVEEGINNPDFVAKIEESTIKELKSKREIEWIQKNPGKAMLKYMGKIEIPFTIKLRLFALMNI